MEYVIQSMAFALLVYLAWQDARTLIVPNRIIWPALGVGLLYRCLFQREDILPIMLICVLFFAAGCIGASGWGDIKVAMFVAFVFGWKIAISAYSLAQVVFLAFYFLKSPKTILQELFPSFNQKETNTKPERPFVPFFLVSILIVISLWRLL